MGSESSPTILFESVWQAAQKLPTITFVVLATKTVIDAIWSQDHLPSQLSRCGARIECHAVSDIIEMHDEPIKAIREKKNSSLVVGLRLLKKHHLNAFISAGNTGALIAGAALSLPLLPGIKRPALLATLPTEKGDVAVLDVGGNVSCKASHLVQFAQMGAAYQRCYQGIERPRVGLLNIGVESKKGTSEVRQAYQLLQALAENPSQRMQFIGNIEGREVFLGQADVLVTDGFTGNVLLKASEGVSFFLLDQLRHVLKDLPAEKQASILHDLRHQFDYEEYSGAIVCGVDCVAVKCHGKSSVKGLFNGIMGAISLVQNGFIRQIKHQLILSGQCES